MKPSKLDLEAAKEKVLGDLIGEGLGVLFVGINPGLYSAAVGFHFGRPGNRFWPALYAGGFTPRVMRPWEQGELLGLGLGVTNIVARASARAEELSREELVAGAEVLRGKVERWRPGWVAVLGVTAYREAFGVRGAGLGEQEGIGGSRVWVLPNPSGLNAHYSAEGLGRLFGELRKRVGRGQG